MRTSTILLSTPFAVLATACSAGSSSSPASSDSTTAVTAADSTARASTEATPAAEAPAVAAVGQPAPDFTLVDQSGASHQLSSLRGKVVVLEWTNPECPFVRRHYEAGTMKRVHAAFPGDRVVWLAIDSSHHHGPDVSRTFRSERSIPWPILQDRDGRVGRRYAARTTPHMFVVDGQGVLRYAGGIDDDPHGEKATPQNYVTDAVQALLDGRDPPVANPETYGCSVKYDG